MQAIFVIVMKVIHSNLVESTHFWLKAIDSWRDSTFCFLILLKCSKPELVGDGTFNECIGDQEIHDVA